MKIEQLHEEQLRQLTGCRYATLRALHQALLAAEPARARGRPLKQTRWVMLVVTLIKLRLDMPYRAIEIMVRLDAVTLHRYVQRIVSALSALALQPDTGAPLKGFLIVDSTGTRVRSTDIKDHSGHKHHKRRKCQAVVTEAREIVSVSRAFAGSVHDTRIWNEVFGATKPDRLVLADKGYVGARGEDEVLLRPYKRSDVAYKADKERAKAFNRSLSKVRVTVEHVFAQMKAFRVLSNLFPSHPDRYGEVFAAVAVIHNYSLRFR